MYGRPYAPSSRPPVLRGVLSTLVRLFSGKWQSWVSRQLTPAVVLNTDTSVRPWPCLSSQQARSSQPLTLWQPELRLQNFSSWLPTWKTLGSVTQCGSLATGVSSRPAYVPIMICWRYYFYLLISLKIFFLILSLVIWLSSTKSVIIKLKILLSTKR